MAEPLLDLKEGIDQLENNKTLGFILSTLLAIGNFLNGTNVSLPILFLLPPWSQNPHPSLAGGSLIFRGTVEQFSLVLFFGENLEVFVLKISGPIYSSLNLAINKKM